MNAIPESHVKQVMELTCATEAQKDMILQVLSRPEPKKELKTYTWTINGRTIQTSVDEMMAADWVFVTSTPVQADITTLLDQLRDELIITQEALDVPF